MTQEQSPPSGPNLTQGVALAELQMGKLVGHVGDQEVLLVHRGTEMFAIAAHCSHYHGPLSEGLVVGDSVRCPWHSQNGRFWNMRETPVRGTFLVEPRAFT